MVQLCRILFFFLLLRPLALVFLGLNVRNLHLLPAKGPALLIANHNSHLDTLVLISLFPYRIASQIRPVAAADYFLRNRWLAWFATNVMQIIPIDRKAGAAKIEMMRGIDKALGEGRLVLLFPEGTRGEPEQLADFKSGIAHIAGAHPNVPLTPVFLHGLGKALPRGEALLVPFFCDVFVGEPFYWTGNRSGFMSKLRDTFQALSSQGHFAPWV
jgi:1-acyl-sn-glycerol-3-phosphate acyltransferase